MKRVFIFSIFLIGCSNNSTSNVLHTSPRENTYIVNNQYLNQEVSIINQHKRYVGDLLEIQVDVKNNTLTPKELEYKIKWFDKDGFKVDETPWLPLYINGKEVKSITSIAHSKSISDFKFYIRKK